MKENRNLFKAIESLNSEYWIIKNSKEYTLGKRLILFKDLLIHFHFIMIFKKVIQLLKIRKLLSYQSKPNNKDVMPSFFEVKGLSNKKIVVYTCIIGDYDVIQDPFIVENNIDYILYTDNLKINSKVWQIRDIPNNIKKINNNVLINRYIKMHPQELFPDYDYSLYIDGNIRIMSEISSLICNINSKTGIAMHLHKARNCLYDEIDACILLKKGSKDKLLKLKDELIKENYPSKNGLLECGIILLDLHNTSAYDICNAWWNYFNASDIHRDQIYFVYALWKLNYKVSDIGILGENFYRNVKFRVNSHQ